MYITDSEILEMLPGRLSFGTVNEYLLVFYIVMF